MKAAVFYGEKDIRVEDVEDPTPSEGEVLLSPRYCGICGTDLDAWNRGMYAPGVVIGHEFSAEVVEVGPDVTEWKKGDRVVANSIIPCKKCGFCRKGKYSLCDDLYMPGITVNGGLAELVVLPSDCLVSIPESVTLQEAALTEPLSVVLHGFNLINFEPGQTALVLGAGTIGLFAAQAALVNGASIVAVSEINAFRRQLAGKLGAHHVIDPMKSNISFVFEEMAGQSPDCVIECTGAASAASETFSLVRKGGTVLVLGISEDPVEADFMTGVLNELTFQFSYCGHSEFPEALNLIAHNMVDARNLITKEITLDAILEGFRELMNPDSNNVKILVKI
ncbi:MAG: alcohol dehydrogenase catalytic domain-containing protein [Theionarchaea archaeon]|nr:alcohol dehydrogenase catalytic domain-containing protein [Theionarchaea archaeon]